MTDTICRTDVERFCASLPSIFHQTGNGPSTVVVTRSPAVVDVMGGICEECGGLALEGVLDVAAAAAAAPREDDRVVICRIGRRDVRFERTLPLSAVSQESLPASSPVGSDGSLDEGRLVHATLSLLRELNALGMLPSGGVTVIVQCDWPTNGGFDVLGAVLAAVAEAVDGLSDPPLDALQKASVCRTASAAIDCDAANMRVPLAALVAEPSCLLQVRTQPQPSYDTLALPEQITIAALETGLQKTVRRERHQENRIAARMGHRWIRELIRLDGGRSDLDGRFLAGITPADYVKRFRDRITTRVTGRMFLDRFGDFPDMPGQIVPEQVYKVRSRVEHVIYENNRVQEFVSAMARAGRTAEPAELERAGELMYASHWSYSQRCGIGLVETDRISNALRARGPDNGFFGCKVTGYGNGGGMVVLMRDTPECHEMLHQVAREIEEASGQWVRVYGGSAPGAARAGLRRLVSAAASSPAAV
jgi:galactokinase